uniref:NBS-LRR-like resistance protein n=1 Tax=Oryza sativa TaxID=4530 RepID=A0A0U2JFK9_ORYSA|nr:NBS-LRR-like resistance protein [Oryza sativa]
MVNLPGRLDELLRRHGNILPKGADQEIPLIRQDIEEITSILHGHHSDATELEDYHDMVVRCWTKEVRELSYDIEDCIDQYEDAVEQYEHAATVGRKRADGVRHVGLDAAINKVQEWLADGEKKLKVVSIVGVGGVGKTTLANELYRKLGRQFECQAFVRSSQKVDMRRLLISMLSQVRLQQPPDNWKLHSLISSIRTHLQDKRYLIIIDDLWDICTWDIIKCTLPDGNSCSRILITTEIEDLALQSCGYESNYIFKMKPLSEDDSRNLFFSTVFGSHSNCPPELCEVSYDIVRKCGGLPLAVVTIASLLATQLEKHEQWDYINEALGYSLMANPNLEGMKQLLNLCYNSLPQHLKACMLYLRMYQENSIIWKDDLVNQWIAEGFICPSEGHEKEEISRAYFSELVDRKFIQPVHINDNGEVLSCAVHHMVLNLITYMSTEENFAIAIDHTQATTRLADKVRRLSIHFGNVEDATPPTNMRLSQVRTLAFCGVLNCMPSITGFQLLKVLILHFCGDEDSISFDLTEISELVRLRYLKVTSNITLKMPTHMQGLQYLEALKIDGKIDAVPSDIVHLPGLLHLSLPARTNPPNGIAHMSSLRTLGYIDLSCNTSENLWSLGELTNLQDLQLTYSAIHSDNLKNNMQYLGSILGKLPNLKSITLSPVGSSYANTLHIHSATSTSVSVYGWSSVSSPPALLQRLELLPCVCIFSSLPNWIGQLGNLCILMIGIREVTSYDVDVLGGLPALTVLSLYVRTKPAESIVFDNARFSVLKYLKFRCSLAWMKFEAGAMPNLRKLRLGFDVHRADQHDAIPVGIENLSGLEEITAKIKVDFTAGDLCRRFAESALTDAIRMHPGRPIVNIRCVDWTFDDKDNNNVRTRDEEHRTTEKQHLIVKEGLNEKSVVLQKDHGEGACKSVEGERRGVLTAGSWWRRQPQFERFYKSAESRADDGGGGGSIISGAQTVPIKNFTGGWPAPPWEEGSGTTMPPVYINEGEYINVIYYSPPRSSTTTSSQDESTEASERERSGSGTGSSEGGFYGPTFQAVGRYLDRKFGLDRED